MSCLVGPQAAHNSRAVQLKGKQWRSKGKLIFFHRLEMNKRDKGENQVRFVNVL